MLPTPSGPLEQLVRPSPAGATLQGTSCSDYTRGQSRETGSLTGQLTSEHTKCSLHLLLHLFASLCHILYFDAAKFSMKRFSLIYFSFSVVRQWNEYEMVIETRPIKTT